MREAGPLILQFGKQVDGIFAPNESSASGTADVLRSQGLNKKVLLMGFDASKPLLQSIQEEDVIGSILQDPYRMGYLSTYYCVQHLRGVNVNKNRTDMSESTGEYLVTKDKLNDVSTLRLYDPATQAARTTEELRYGPKGKR